MWILTILKDYLVRKVLTFYKKKKRSLQETELQVKQTIMISVWSKESEWHIPYKVCCLVLDL